MAIASIVLNVIIILILLFYKRLEHFFAQKGKDDALTYERDCHTMMTVPSGR